MHQNSRYWDVSRAKCQQAVALVIGDRWSVIGYRLSASSSAIVTIDYCSSATIDTIIDCCSSATVITTQQPFWLLKPTILQPHHLSSANLIKWLRQALIWRHVLQDRNAVFLTYLCHEKWIPLSLCSWNSNRWQAPKGSQKYITHMGILRELWYCASS